MSLHHGLVEGEYSLHALGGRDAFDPISQILVASSPKGWHCPQVFAVSWLHLTYLTKERLADDRFRESRALLRIFWPA